MRHILKLHPDSRCDATVGVEVDATRPAASELSLHYFLTGADRLNIPAFAHFVRADKLWERTCLEAFVTAVPGGAYYEFNFSPSTAWAAYRFPNYRESMMAPKEILRPSVELRYDSPQRFELRAHLGLGGFPDLPADEIWHIGLSAVIEETRGRKSYWALAHPPGKPDFHHPDCFALTLPAPMPS
jgi:hypothetical protein